jgi:uncharacterized damage-inducible protein DinB
MTALLVVRQLRFARSEFMRCLQGVSEEDAVQRPLPMNCLSWIVGHLADQEQGFWCYLPHGEVVVDGLHDLVGFGKPASTPPLAEMLAAWQQVTRAADRYLDTLTPELLQEHFQRRGKPMEENIGMLLQRNIFHYWFHTGEAHAVRQMLGHADLPQFVGSMEMLA